MSEQYANGVQTTLNGAIDNAVTSLTVLDPSGMPATGDFRILVCKADESNTELMKVTARSGSVLTLVRGAEPYAGSSAPHAHDDGEFVTVVLTVAGLTGIVNSFAEIYGFNNFI